MRKRLQFLKAGLVLAGIVSAGAASAATISYADAITVLARDCGADIKKFCKDANIGNNEIGNCLRQNQAQVSPTCTASLATVVASIQTRLAAQKAISRICLADFKNWCPGVVPGDSHILDCLLKVKFVSPKCNQAINDAGWR